MKKLSYILTLLACVTFMSSCSLYRSYIYSNKDILISNPCEGETGLDFKIVSLIGDKNKQTITLTGKFINHDVNKDVTVGGNFLAYDQEGNPHSGKIKTSTFRALTDAPIRFTIDVPGQMVPKRNKKMTVMSFDISDCRIELRNVPIIWKTIEEEKK